MPVSSSLPQLAGFVLIAAAPLLVGAEAPLPDPIAPAVIGRPLDQLRPARPARQESAAAKPIRRKQVSAAKGPPAGRRSATPVAAAAPAARAVTAAQHVQVPSVAPSVAAQTQVMGARSAPARAAKLAAYFTLDDEALIRRSTKAIPRPPAPRLGGSASRCRPKPG